VEYEAESGTSNYRRVIGYEFSGGNWAGSIESSRLRIDFHLPVTYFVWANKPPVLNRRENRLSGEWLNWEGGESLELYYEPSDSGSVIMNLDKGKLIENFACRYGDFAGDRLNRFLLPRPEKSGFSNDASMGDVFQKDGVVFIDFSCLLGILEAYGLLEYASDFEKHEEFLKMKMIPALDPSKRIHFYPDDPYAYFGADEKLPLPTPPLKTGEHDDLYVPLKPIATLFGFSVETDWINHEIFISRQ